MWKDFELFGAASVAPKSPLASVSRIEGSMEVWWFRPDGGVQGAYWYEGGQWTKYELAPANSAIGNSLTAVSRIPGSLEVWWRGADGSLQAAYWYDGHSWQRYSIAPAGSVTADSGMASVSRLPNTMELWWVAPDGAVKGAYWYDGGQWQTYTLAPAGSASTATSIAAVSRIPGSMEVWWVAPNGAVKGAYWYEGGQWQLYELSPPNSASNSSGIAAVSRIPGSMEVWWVGNDASIKGAYWYDGANWSTYTLAPAASATIGTKIAAVSRITGSMEIWWCDSTRLKGAYWYDGQPWKLYSLGNYSLSGLGGLAAVSRLSTSMEIWAVGVMGSLVDTYWYDNLDGARKQILSKYQSLGGLNSKLGLPVDARFQLIPTANGVKVNFRGGNIEFKSGSIEAIKQYRVEVWWMGIECQIRQETADELYGVVGVIVPGTGLSRSEKYPDATTGTITLGPDNLRIAKIGVKLYDGPPVDIVLAATLVESDSGDTGKIKQKLADAVSDGAKGLAASLGMPAEALAATDGWVNDLSQGLVNAVANLLGVDDDQFTPQQIRLTWTEMLAGSFTKQVLRRNDDSNTLPYTHSVVLSGVDEGGDLGKYGFYFDVRLFQETQIL